MREENTHQQTHMSIQSWVQETESIYRMLTHLNYRELLMNNTCKSYFAV